MSSRDHLTYLPSDPKVRKVAPFGVGVHDPGRESDYIRFASVQSAEAFASMMGALTASAVTRWVAVDTDETTHPTEQWPGWRQVTYFNR